MIELFYIGMPLVRTDGRSLARTVYGHVITKFSWMGSLPHFLTHGAPLRASRARAPLKIQKIKSPGIFSLTEKSIMSNIDLTVAPI